MSGLLRFRTFVDGHLRCTHWVSQADPDAAHQVDAIGHHQASIAHAADQAGQVWMAEVFDTAAPTEQAYTRFGTDPEGMHRPQAVQGIDDLLARALGAHPN